jgi:isopentenyldiphosphate isomerase
MPKTRTPASNIESLIRLHEHLLARADEEPPLLARALTIAGRPCGWITQAAREALSGSGLLREEADALHLAPDLAPGDELNAALARVAHLLRAADCLRGWRDELLDVVDRDDRPFAAIERAAVRPLGLPTRAVHLSAWTPDGRMWMARRSLTKSTDPGMWDTLVGGLVGRGEGLELALERECGEEAGLEPPQLRGRDAMRTILRLRRRLPEGYQVEDLLVSTCVLAPDVRPANRDGEVMEIAAALPDEVIERLEAGEFTLEAALVIVADMLDRLK